MSWTATISHPSCTVHPDLPYGSHWILQRLSDNQAVMACPECGHGDHVQMRAQVYENTTLIETRWGAEAESR